MAPPGAGARPPTMGRHFPDLRVDRGELPGARWCVTTRFGGWSSGSFAESNLAEHVGDDMSAVAANRGAVVELFPGITDVAFVQAEHGAQVHRVAAAGEVPTGDALVTDASSLGLAALGADCAVVGLSAQRSGGDCSIAVLHCGWKGLVADVVGATVTQLRTAGATRITAVQGPAICGACYDVPVERCEAIVESVSATVAQATVMRRQRDVTESWGIDIGAGVQARLEELGVDVLERFGCTYEAPKWFSLRRAVKHEGPSARTGRHALAMAMAPS